MDKLISANAVLKGLGCFTDTEHGNPHFLNGIATAREIVKDAPEAVVRCKDCIHRNEDEMCEYKHYLVVAQDDNDFCSWGEKKCGSP